MIQRVSSAAVVFALLSCAGAMAQVPAPVPRAPSPPAPGIDVSISAIAAGSTGTSGPSRSIQLYSTASSSQGLPAGAISMSYGTTSCNVQLTNNAPNKVPDWYEAWDSAGNATDGSPLGQRHPYIASNTYRVNADGRLEQLSAAWVKHGWLAASASQSAVPGANGQPACGTGTCAGPSGNQLGANCADTYGSTLNDDRRWLGPRTEIRTRGGADSPGWTQRGSFFDSVALTAQGVDTLAPLAQREDNIRSYNPGTAFAVAQANKMNQLRLADISRAALVPPGAPASQQGLVIMEGYYVVNGDAFKLNNVAHRRFRYTPPAAGSPTSANFAFDGPHTFGPAIFTWGDRKTTALPETEGTVYVSSRVVNVAPGLFRYEYNVYNHDLDRQLSAISIPLPATGAVSEMNFWQPAQHSPVIRSVRDDAGVLTASYLREYEATPWAGEVNDIAKEVRFAAPAPLDAGVPVGEPGNFANTLRWGTMYTFWFQSNRPPRTTGMMTLTQALPGAEGPLTASGIQVPTSIADIVSIGGIAPPDGEVTVDDYTSFINAFAGDEILADVVSIGGFAPGDGELTVDDYTSFINAFAEEP